MTADTWRPTEPQTFSPSAFAKQVIEAVLPLVDPNDQENLRSDVGRKDIYLAVVPFFAEYTIADAVATHAMISTVRDSTPYGTGDRYESACAALDILQDFICNAFASGPECVAAMAHFATLTMGRDTDEPVAVPVNFRRLLEQIGGGIGEIRSGARFEGGERFGVPEGEPLVASWLGRGCDYEDLNTLRAESVAEGANEGGDHAA